MLRLLPDDYDQKRIIEHTAQWEADVAPLSHVVNPNPHARVAVLVVAAEDRILISDALDHAPSEPEAIGKMIADAVRQAVAAGSTPPSEVRVKHPAVAAYLEPVLRQEFGAHVETKPILPLLMLFNATLRRAAEGKEAPMAAVTQCETWGGWDLAPERLHELLAAASDFYTDSPWTELMDSDVIKLDLPSGTTWYACVFGSMEEEYGVTIYERFDDVAMLFDDDDIPEDEEVRPEDLSVLHTGIVLALTFTPRSELPAEMGREFARNGFPVAGPLAYPALSAQNTIGGGITNAHAADLIAILRTLGPYSRWTTEPIDADQVLSWKFDGTGVTSSMLLM